MAAYANQARTQWALQWPGQTVICVSKLYWTADVTNALSDSSVSLADYRDMCTNELNEIVKLVRSPLSTQNRTTLGRKYVCMYVCM